MYEFRRKISLTPTFCVVAFSLLLACNRPVKDVPSVSIEEAEEVLNEPRYLSGDDLGVWSKVDTTGRRREVLEVLRTFFDQKMRKSDGLHQDFWLLTEYAQFVRDYSEIRYAEFGEDASVSYWPTLLEIESIEDHEHQYFATVRWASLDSLGGPDEIKYVFKFLVKPNQHDELRLATPTKQLTSTWEKKKVGDVTFVLSPKHKFSRKQAEYQQEKIEELQAFFEVDPFPITFYSFHYSTELLMTRGYVQHPMFYKFETGGQAGVGDVVYSGNGRDEYVHEVVHLYLSKAIPKSTGILNEGLATLLGGSSGYPFEWHKEKLKTWLLANPKVELQEHLNPYQSQYIEEDTSIPYLIGALLCERILSEHGKEALFESLAVGKDPWAHIESYGIAKSNLREVLLDQVAK